MVSFAEIQNGYNNIYREIRKYIWDFPVVACLADLEIACYKTCQSLEDLRIKFARLKGLVIDVLYEDEDFKKAMDYFEDLINESSVYVKLNQVQEVIDI